ncbi:basic proline-rich protein-like [Onychostoma macrolepis]|uniref:basic proline-rich protein-like n=1 Tax=Onychostoma macrolepis TaxID=369639 RepID=UPI00272C7457|nr:basic proline-rich protein-like [Onychostoma macrolepis]
MDIWISPSCKHIPKIGTLPKFTSNCHTPGLISPRLSRSSQRIVTEDTTQFPSTPPPASETRTPPRHVNPSTPPWLLAPSSPPWPGSPLAPPGSLVLPAPPWSGVDHPAPRDSTPLALPRPFVPPAPSGSFIPSPPPLFSVALAPCGLSYPRLCVSRRHHLLRLGPPDPPRHPCSAALRLSLGLLLHLLLGGHSSSMAPPPIMAVAWVLLGASCSGSLLSPPWLLPPSSPPWPLSAGPLPGVRPPPEPPPLFFPWALH